MAVVIQITDCHLMADPHKAGYGGIKPAQTLANILAEVALICPDLVLVTGDISGDDSDESYALFLHLWQQSGVQARLVTIPGNHDQAAGYDRFLAPYQLTVDEPIVVSGWQILGLDTRYEGTLGYVSDAQLQRLERTLDTLQGSPCLLAVHHHPLAFEGWMDTHEWTNREDFIRCISCFNQVQAVVYGHIHHVREQRIGHIDYLSCPSTCWQWARQENFATDPTQPGFRVLELGADNHYQTRIIRLNQE